MRTLAGMLDTWTTVVLEIRDRYVAALKEKGIDPSSTLRKEGATAKEIYDVLSADLRQHRMPRDLAEPFEAHWDSFLADIRLSRNATGHPKTITPVSRDEVRAGFLQLRSVLKVAAALREWISSGVQEAPNRGA